PMAIGVPQIGRNRFLQDFGVDGLGHPAVHQIYQVADVHGHQDIGGRALAFGLNAFFQSVLQKDGVDLAVRLAGERIEKRLNESRLPRCVYIDLLGRRRTGSNGKQGGHSDEGCAQSGKGNTHEIQTPFLVVMAARHFILNESYYQVAFAASPHRTTLLNRYGSISLYLKYKFSPECMLSPVKKARAPKSWPHSGPRERPIEGEWWSQAESNRR